MDGLVPDGRLYVFSSWLFLRGLGLVYLIAFLSAAGQVKGLIGTEGILPANLFLRNLTRVLGRRKYLAYPTLGWINASDTALVAGCWLGALAGLLVFVGIQSTPLLILLWALYLSLINLGQDFLSFQWDVLLVEAGFLAIFLLPPVIVSLQMPGIPSAIPILLLRLLIFRLMFMSGALKLISRDPTWKSLTALEYHYETQPLPTPLAYPFFWAPKWFNRFSTAVALFIEIIPPFFFFGPWIARVAAVLLTVTLQVLIELTGNFAFFNILTILLAIPLLDDRFFGYFLPDPVIAFGSRMASQATSWFSWIIVPVGIILGVSGILFIAARLTGRSGILSRLNPLIEILVAFRLVNPYGLFVSMTTQRPEIILEGSQDSQTWEPYEFKCKVGDPARRPTVVAPHQPRLDWQMWFAALGTYPQNPWFVQFVIRLLTGSETVNKLLRAVPFNGRPPRYVRARLYDYHYAPPERREREGVWWSREELGDYLPPVSLGERAEEKMPGEDNLNAGRPQE